jgi:hypothetical protein
MIAPSGCVNKASIPGVDADVGNAFAFGGSEKNQIAFFQPVSTHSDTFLPLSLRGSGKIQTVQFVHRHGETTAVKSLFGGFATPPVGDANETVSGLDDVVSSFSG